MYWSGLRRRQVLLAVAIGGGTIAGCSDDAAARSGYGSAYGDSYGSE